MLKKIFLILPLCLGLLLGSGVKAVWAWNDCPFGRINDPYPGSCFQYTDSDGDGLCDHSQSPPEERSNGQGVADYHVVFIGTFMLLSYGASFYLSKVGRITVAAHRQLWNVFLVISFLGTALTGALLGLKIVYQIEIVLPFNSFFWHVETGTAMTLIALFHLSWHLPYYWRIFKMR